MEISKKDQFLIMEINQILQSSESEDIRNLFLLKSLQNLNCLDGSADSCKHYLIGSWLCRLITEKIKYIEDKLNEEENENESLDNTLRL